jgi:ParB family chromosome partitioning protein
MTNISIQYIQFKLIIKPNIPMRLNTQTSHIKELAESIDKVGLINPIHVLPIGKYYEIVAGFRRYLAIATLKWKEVPCIVVQPNPELAVGIMTAENYEREDVNVFEESIYLQKLINETKYTQKAIALLINRSESYVSERIAIFNYSSELQNAIANNKISFSVARELYKIDDPSDQLQYVLYAIQNGCTPEIARRWRKELNERKNINSDDIADKAIENYDNSINTTIVSMLCKVCGDNVNINDLEHIYVCKTCVQVLRKAGAL